MSWSTQNKLNNSAFGDFVSHYALGSFCLSLTDILLMLIFISVVWWRFCLFLFCFVFVFVLRERALSWAGSEVRRIWEELKYGEKFNKSLNINNNNKFKNGTQKGHETPLTFSNSFSSEQSCQHSV